MDSHMKTRTCKQCGYDKPEKQYHEFDKGRGRIVSRAVCHDCRRELRNGPKKGPPRYETLRETNDLWPCGRTFSPSEFKEGLEDNTWPLGMGVKYLGQKYMVGESLRRLK